MQHYNFNIVVNKGKLNRIPLAEQEKMQTLDTTKNKKF